jgi:hypothetical protein
MTAQWNSVEALLKPHFVRLNVPATPPPTPPGMPSVRPSRSGDWSLEMTPPYPSKWPVAPDTPLSYYGYASRLQPGLCDAAEIAGVWGVVVAVSGALTFSLLAERLERTGVESRYPPGPALIQMWKSIESRGPVERLLIEAATDVGAASLLHQYYAHWTGRSSVGRDALSRHHELARFLAGDPTGLGRDRSGSCTAAAPVIHPR